MASRLDELAAETGWLRRLARSLVHDTAAAEDLVHDAYVVAAERAPRDGRPLRPWLVRVMTNLTRMGRRGAQRRGAREAAVAELADPVATPEALAGRVELHRLLAELVLALSPDARDVVLLHYFEDLSSAEIGKRLGISAGTVRWRLKHALDELRDRLDARQPQRAWVAAMAAFAGAPARASGVGWLVAAAIALILVASWLVVDLRRVEHDAEPTSEVWQARHRAARAQATAAGTGGDPAAMAPPPLEPPPPPGQRRLTGRVIDGEGQPVAGAEITATCGFLGLEDAGEPPRTRSVAGGAFSIEVDSTCDGELFATHEGRSAIGYATGVEPNEPFLLKLQPDVIATIRVIDAASRAPIAGARVSVRAFPSASGGAPVVSDAAGVARLALLAPSPGQGDDLRHDVVFVARAEAHAPGVVHALSRIGELRRGPIERTIELTTGIPISGTVLGPGDRPVAGADVEVTGPRGQPDEVPWGHGGYTGADGRFEVRVPRAGVYKLVPHTDALAPVNREQGVFQIGDRGGAGITLRLVPRPEVGLKGVVVDARGARVAGARITSPEAAMRGLTSDANGEFVIAHHSWPFALVARSGDLASEAVRGEVREGEITHVTLTLGPAGISGVVVDPGGQPIAGAELWLNSDGSPGAPPIGRRSLTDEHGGFWLDVPRGAFRISVRRSSEDDFLDQDDVVLTGGTRDARIVLP